jgi:hypothetical protein
MSNLKKVGLTIAVAGATASMVGTVNGAGNNLDIWPSNNNESSADQGQGCSGHTDVSQACRTAGADGKRSAYNIGGDAAIVPYYTTVGDFVTGVHMINTTAATQAIKVRLRRGSDSADALDFNVIMSPQDMWVASIDDTADGSITVSTSDTTCTVPVGTVDSSGTKTFTMPSTSATGASEGYVEIIAMGQAAATTSASKNATHSKGTPLDCATLEKNFYRNMNGASSGNATTARYCGDNTSVAASGSYGVCTNAQTTDGVTGGTATTWTDTPDEALKVSWFIRDSVKGLEFGGNAAHISGFSTNPMMTNQEAIATQDGYKQFDPLNFELPNLDGGPHVWNAASGDGTTADSLCDAADAGATVSNGALCSDSVITAGGNWGLFQKLRANNMWGKTAIRNDWAARSNDTRTVMTDWVVTFPGQYLMRDWRPLPPSNAAGTVAATNQTVSSYDDLPVVYSITMYDREEASATSTVTTCTQGGIQVSPSVDNCDTAAPPPTYSFANEVNVMAFGGATFNGGKGLLNSNYQNASWSLDGADRGWATLNLTTDAKVENIFYPVPSGQNGVNATGALVEENLRPPVLGYAVWERNLVANSAANYGRAVEHSWGQSSGGW